MNWEENKEEIIRIYSKGEYAKEKPKLIEHTVNGNGFNIFAALFSPLYLLYRKLYLYGVALFAVSFVPDILKKVFGAPNVLEYIYYIVAFIVCGFAFYPLYQSHIKSVFDKYKDSENCEEQLKKKGGTNPLIVLLYFAIIIGGILIHVAMVRYNYYH